MSVRALATVVQFVSDPARAGEWYTRLLGVAPTPYGAPYFRFGEGAYLILAPSASGTGRGGTGVWFEVEDVEQAYRQLTADGFVFNEPPYAIPPGNLVTLFDPDGNLVGLIDNSSGGMPAR